MSWIVYHILAGHVFFVGIALLVVASWSSLSSRPILLRLGNFAFVIGLIALAFSSTPIPYWIYGAGFATSVLVLFDRCKNFFGAWLSYLSMAIWLLAAFVELPYHILPTISATTPRQIAIIGDSVTAGIGSNETSETWPKILAQQHSLDVVDLSRAGATTAIALGQVQKQTIVAPIVIVEIGGNDILGETSYEEFAKNLDLLVSHLARNDRQILMFELPFPPFSHEYGRIQRAIASKYGVALLPKRTLLSVLAGKDSSLDIVHLSQSGHERMAKLIWELIRPAFERENSNNHQEG